MFQNDEFSEINSRIDKERKQKKNISLAITLTLVAAALLFLFYSYIKFKEANEHVRNTEKELIQLKKEHDSIQVYHAKKVRVFNNFAKQFKAFNWEVSDLKTTDSLVINQAIKANVEITNILSKEENYTAFYSKKIRYYEKAADSGAVISALNRTPFSNKYTPNASYYQEKTNRIIAHHSVHIKYLQYTALILLQEGVNIKEIRRFRVNDPLKKNFIEISSDKYLMDKPNLTFKDIMNITEEQL